jgi:glyoxylase-like metal-dependent hydrolase (beta-lactamase superfamily II)
MGRLNIIQIAASDMQNFAYLLYCPETLQGAAIDPSMEPQRLLKTAKKLGIELRYLLNTHGHNDHIAGNDQILAETGAKLGAHPADMADAEIALTEGSVIQLGRGTIEVLHTPGHTPGSVVFKSGNLLITGDTLFVGRCGRADFPGSDVTALYTSLQRLKELPPETIVYPGHDYGATPTSSIQQELSENDYLKCSDLESFIRLRMD